MASTMRVRIDLARLAANLSAAEGATVSEEDAGAFLAKNQFTPLGGDAWFCDAVNLRLLDPSEILDIQQPR